LGGQRLRPGTVGGNDLEEPVDVNLGVPEFADAVFRVQQFAIWTITVWNP